MRTTYLAGAGLGLVAAVVFASATTGPLFFRLLLMFVTPLPIALAGLGWGWRAAIVAGGVGTGLILVFGNPAIAAAFALTQAAPIAVLTYLALLSRPLSESGVSVTADDASAVEWYPPGRLVIWSAVMAGLMAIAMLMVIGGDLETLRKALADFIRTTFEAGLPRAEGQAPLSEAEIASLSEIALGVLPAASAMSWMGSLLFNLWLAGRVTRASGQLGRPWPDLAAITYPTGTPLAFGAMLLATMLTGYAGLAASAFAGGLFLAYLLLGLAILHYTTRGQPWRPIALWALYGSLLIVNVWIGIVIAMLGLAETVLQLRARSGAPPGPPPHQPHA
ncbi:DUF2232 domain-containing protein [Hyphomicrobium sp.]|uniref:DUF2232 domain-containing protein n=1 Tax=Hyphomicrobium sp. TaxID=82 RepID=UPI0025BFA779|nr:DUF2232 domain-containing protein [Hyphomicrobium sp.]MCC7253789.1 DUF2232 domain-containing protein [Hyphomicrobium sp.]